MRAIDANVVLRLLLRDHPDQARIADALLRDGVLIPITVLLEVGWVLRSRYGLSRPDVAAMLAALIDDGSVTIDGEAKVVWALKRYQRGGDLADLIHLAAAGSADSFATFDVRLAKAAGADSPVPIETLVA